MLKLTNNEWENAKSLDNDLGLAAAQAKRNIRPKKFRRYLANHSLGQLPSTRLHHRAYIEDWGINGVHGHFEAYEGDPAWIEYHRGEFARRCEELYGAGENEAGVHDCGLTDALALGLGILHQPDRPGIVTIANEFPSDRILASTFLSSRGLDPAEHLRQIQPDGNGITTTEAVIDAISTDTGIGLLMVPEVHYLTGAHLDVPVIATKARELGIRTIIDTAHALGNTKLTYGTDGLAAPDFAAGCSYKYLGAGPGNSAIVYLNPIVAQQIHVGEVSLPFGWFSYANPASFLREGLTADNMDPSKLAPGVHCLRRSNVNIASASILWDALDHHNKANPDQLREITSQIKAYFLSLMAQVDPDAKLKLLTPSTAPGAMLTYEVPTNLVAAMKSQFAEKGIEVDWRGQPNGPSILRFSFPALYNNHADACAVAMAIDQVLNSGN